MNALREACVFMTTEAFYNTMNRPQFTTTSFIEGLYHYVILQNLISCSFVYSYLNY